MSTKNEKKFNSSAGLSAQNNPTDMCTRSALSVLHSPVIKKPEEFIVKGKNNAVINYMNAHEMNYRHHNCLQSHIHPSIILVAQSVCAEA